MNTQLQSLPPESVYLGIGLDHDAGVVFTDPEGLVLWAASEERFSRKKNHYGFPFKALRRGMLDLQIANSPERIISVILGTYANLTLGRARNIIDCIEPREYSLSNFGKNTDIEAPGRSPADEILAGVGASEEELKVFVSSYLGNFLHKEFGITSGISFTVHHNSHAASALFASTFERALVVSLDGQGDGESGLIAIGDRNSPDLFSHQVRIPAKDSLGHIYGAVTNRYGLKTNRHEGKILGLAALGKPSQAIDQLRRLITIKDGTPSISIPCSESLTTFKSTPEGKLFRHTDFLEWYIRSIDVKDFPDLAYAVQTVLEESVLEIIRYWVDCHKVDRIVLAGGIFANVKLNQLIAETMYPAKIYIYPNMGDGGLPAGGVWHWMHQNGKSVTRNPQPSMLIGTLPSESSQKIEALDMQGVAKFDFSSDDELAKITADLLVKNYYCGLVDGRMEFGPRALCHRTILADPRSKTVNHDLNNRLKRTEYMPFAPVCMAEYFSDLFIVSKHASLVPFKYMTMLCGVREDWHDIIPAVVHVDGTARPQYVTKEENGLIHKILSCFHNITGIPCLINTSFNVHEEPIINSVDDALRALRSSACDCVITSKSLYYLTGNMRIENDLSSYK